MLPSFILSKCYKIFILDKFFTFLVVCTTEVNVSSVFPRHCISEIVKRNERIFNRWNNNDERRIWKERMSRLFGICSSNNGLHCQQLAFLLFSSYFNKFFNPSPTAKPMQQKANPITLKVLHWNSEPHPTLHCHLQLTIIAQYRFIANTWLLL